MTTPCWTGSTRSWWLHLPCASVSLGTTHAGKELGVRCGRESQYPTLQGRRVVALVGAFGQHVAQQTAT
eukprot:12899091-Prorocentrum_lima.AAC.1